MRQKYTEQQNIDSFWNKVQFTTDCWIWLGGKNIWGYGQFWNGSKTIQAHRFSYQLWCGVITNKQHLDHICRNRKCVNPNHLEIVTQKENIMRGIGITSINSKKTHCKRGHLLNGDNLYTYDNQRKCKECRRMSWRKWKNAQ